jgi:GAF domain-containing protein
MRRHTGHRTWVNSIPFKEIANSAMTDSTRNKALRPTFSEGTDELKVEAAMLRLRYSTDEENALEAIREIVANLLGSEEMGMYKVDEDKAVLWLYWSFGLDPEAHLMLDTLHEPVLQQVIRGEIYLKNSGGDIDGSDSDAKTTAYVPLRYRGRVVAVLAIFSWLPQKKNFDESDVEILKVLSNEAATALFDAKQPFLSRLLEGQL